MPRLKPEVHEDYVPKPKKRKRPPNQKLPSKKRKTREDLKQCPGLGRENTCVLEAFQIVMKEGSDANGDPVSPFSKSCFVVIVRPLNTSSGVLVTTRNVELPAYKTITPTKPLRKMIGKHCSESHMCSAKSDRCKQCRRLCDSLLSTFRRKC